MTEKPKQHADKERERIKDEEDEVVRDSDQSFPASDPPSFNPGITGPTDVEPLEKEADKKNEKKK